MVANVIPLLARCPAGMCQHDRFRLLFVYAHGAEELGREGH